MKHFEPGTEKKTPHEKEIQRIQNKLEEYLSNREARETAVWIYELALDVDGEIGRILKDPLVGRLYEYDGLFFTPRGTSLFHRAFDGIHILQSLDNSKIDTFFRGRDQHAALQWLMDELGTHKWEATVRRMNWEEEGQLGVLSKAVVEEIVQDVRERRRLAEADSLPFSAEEQAFFQPYEDEMAEFLAGNRTASPKR